MMMMMTHILPLFGTLFPSPPHISKTDNPDNTRPQTTPSTIMKVTFTCMTMPCAMLGLLSSAFLKTAMSAEPAEAMKNVTVPVLNATVYPANVSLGSRTRVSVSSVVGAHARV